MTQKSKQSDQASERFKTVLEHIGPEFIRESAKQIGSEDLESVFDQLDEVEAQFCGESALARYTEQSKLLVGLVRDYHEGRYLTASYWTMAVAVFALAYILKPIDIIPDSLPVIGQLDDAVVLSHCLTMVEKDLHAYKVWSMARDAERS